MMNFPLAPATFHNNYKEKIIELLERIDSGKFPGRAGLVNSEKFLTRIYVSLREYVRESEGEA